MKKILVINGHPNPESYNYALAESYIKGAKEANAIVERIDIGALDFNPNLKYGYQKVMPLEADLQEAIEKIRSAEHIIWIFPMWWYGYPAIMKGFIDRVFLPNIAFKYNRKPFPDRLFKGKTGRIIIIADTPKWYDYWIMKRPAINQMKKGTLEFSGIRPVKVTYIAPIKDAKEVFLQRWMDRVYDLGKRMK